MLHFCPTTPLVLVGLKSDLRTKSTCIELLKTQGLTPVTPAQGSAVAKRMGATYVECSSKEMIGVKEIFDMAVEMSVTSEDEYSGFGGSGAARGRFPSDGSRDNKRKHRNPCKIL